MESNLWKQFQDAGSIEKKPGQGRARAKTAREDRYFCILARRNRGATASQLSRDLYAAAGTRVIRRLSRIMQEENVNSFENLERDFVYLISIENCPLLTLHVSKQMIRLKTPKTILSLKLTYSEEDIICRKIEFVLV
ncbi:hypothetical protein X975_15521, partial [Stegodyphus mimosarum]